MARPCRLDYLYHITSRGYIHLNPVRAKIVDNPLKCKWSSYHGYMSRKGDGYINIESREFSHRRLLQVSIDEKQILKAVAKI